MYVSRLVMVVDDERSSLGGIALQLCRLGIDTLYCNDLDEACLQAREERGRLAAILIPARSSEERVAAVRSRVAAAAKLPAQALAILGRRPEEAALEKLRAEGIHWGLWEPYDEMGLRFVARAPMWVAQDDDLRLDLRVPTALTANATCDSEVRRVLVADLTPNGAFLETPSPFAQHASIELELPLPGEAAVIAADVRWINARTNAHGPVAFRPSGMGVEFSDPEREVQTRIRAFIETEIQRHRI